jgi:Protein of unknown function (DUF2568)
MRPINLALRFALELAALAAFGAWGLHAAGGPARFAVAAAAVLAAAGVWGRWMAPTSTHRLADPARLLAEAAFFTAAGAALALTGRGALGAALAVAAVANAGMLRLLHHDTVPSREGRP